MSYKMREKLQPSAKQLKHAIALSPPQLLVSSIYFPLCVGYVQVYWEIYSILCLFNKEINQYVCETNSSETPDSRLKAIRHDTSSVEIYNSINNQRLKMCKN